MIAVLVLVVSLARVSVARARNDPDFFRPSPTEIVYSRTEPIPSTEKGMRSYVWDFTIKYDIGGPDYVAEDHHLPTQKAESWADLVADKLAMAFDSIATTVLASKTDTSVVTVKPLPRDLRKHLVLGFPELESTTTVCRAHQKKPSLVLPAPYYEDVEYCVRLILDPREPDDRSKGLRLQAEANITLTKNPKTTYRKPSGREILPFKELLLEFVTEIRVELEKSTRDQRWSVEKWENGTLRIFDLDRWARLRYGKDNSEPTARLGSGNDADFSHPRPNKIVYERTWEGRCPPGHKCAAPERAYLFDVSIYIRAEDGQENFDLEDRAAHELLKAFGGIARTVLATKTDTTAIGWQDLEDTVCRAHQQKPSLVLPAPYFEDVEYCFRLIRGQPPHTQLRLQAETGISVTKNPSHYHPPQTQEEITPFTELLVKLGAEIRVELEKSAKAAGWHVIDEGFGTFTIDGLSK